MNEAIRPDARSQAQEGPELSVIVPTFNERDNVTVLYRRLEATLANVAWEVVFVDDNSPDGTWDVVRALAQQDSRVRCVRRIGRRTSKAGRGGAGGARAGEYGDRRGLTHPVGAGDRHGGVGGHR